MLTKEGVRLDTLQPQMVLAHFTVAAAYAEEGADCIITSGNDGKHKRSKLHANGHALDYRTRHLTPEARNRIADKVRARLGELYDVILEEEPPHMHVEHDPPPPPHTPPQRHRAPALRR